MTRLLVIGYGNELRCDDAAGPVVARLVAAWDRPGVHALDVHQLTPELTPFLARCERVVFVDADASGGAEVRVSVVAPGWRAGPSHSLDPGSLLELTHWLYGKLPRGWLVTIPAECFELGEGLSPRTREGVAEAATWLRRLADE